MKVSIAEFRMSMGMYIKQLPVELTSHGKVVAVVVPPDFSAPLHQEIDLNAVVRKPVVSEFANIDHLYKPEVVEPVDEVRIWWEDGVEHEVTKSQVQAKFGKYWEAQWEKMKR